jgi:hypothetical protein
MAKDVQLARFSVIPFLISWLVGLGFGFLFGIKAFEPGFASGSLLSGSLRICFGILVGNIVAVALFRFNKNSKFRLNARNLFGSMISVVGGMFLWLGFVFYLYPSGDVRASLLMILFGWLTPGFSYLFAHLVNRQGKQSSATMNRS